MRIVIIGTGYVGLVTGAGLAQLGHYVTCVDIDVNKIDRLIGGEIPIYEPGLSALVTKARAERRLGFSSDPTGSLLVADAAFLCVGTPPRPDDGNADISQVLAAARVVASLARPGTVIVTKSTVPVGTGDILERAVLEKRPGVSLPVVSNPEFLREGAAVKDFLEPERIVVGVESAAAAAVMKEIYHPLTSQGILFISTRRRTAEIIKYAANCFLAIKVNYINELATLCEEVGADIDDVALGIGTDSRIGRRFLQPGPGFGGSCFPKDMLALIKTAQEHGSPLRSVETAVAVNDARKGDMVRKIVGAAGGSIAGKTIAILGLTFKADTDDMRSAASLVIVPRLQALGATVRAYDPQGMRAAAPLLPAVEMSSSVMSCIQGADAVVILTEWPEFRALSLKSFAHALGQPVLVDLRNLFRADEATKAGLRYFSVGRPPAGPGLAVGQIH